MNFFAGIFIGLANDNWPAVLIVPLFWGFIRIIYIVLIRQDIIEEHKQDFNGRWVGPLFLVDYPAATIMAFIVSVITYTMKLLILWII